MNNPWEDPTCRGFVQRALLSSHREFRLDDQDARAFSAPQVTSQPMADQDHGKAPVESAVVKLVEDKVAIFRRNGLPSATVGTNVKLIVTMNRRRKVLNAKAEMEEEEFELDVGKRT